MKSCIICGFETFNECTYCACCGTVFPKRSGKAKVKVAQPDTPENGYHVPSNYQNWRVSRKPWFDCRCDKASLEKKGQNAAAWLLDGDSESLPETHRDAGFIVQRPSKRS